MKILTQWEDENTQFYSCTFSKGPTELQSKGSSSRTLVKKNKGRTITLLLLLSKDSAITMIIISLIESQHTFLRLPPATFM